MPKTKEVSIEIEYERHSDGRYYIRSRDLPGFRLAGTDIDALQRDLDPAVKDLLLYNMGFEVDRLRWVPTPEEAKRALRKPVGEGKTTYVARLKHAA